MGSKRYSWFTFIFSKQLEINVTLNVALKWYIYSLPSSVVEKSVDVSLESRLLSSNLLMSYESFCLFPSELSPCPLAPLLNWDLNFRPRSNIFFGLRHQSCSGRIQFQSTQGNQRGTPISIVRKTMSCVLRLVKSTLKKKNCHIYFRWKSSRYNRFWIIYF